MKITTINALIEILNSDSSVNRVYISTERKDKRIKEIIELCKKRGVPFIKIPSNALEKKAGEKNQGVYAEISPVKFSSIDDITGKEAKGLILVLDSVEDTGNLGAIIRSAAACEVDGIIISKRNSAPVNDTVMKTSAGTLSKVKIVQSTNLSNDMEILKKRGYWIAGSVSGEGIPYYDFDFSYPVAIIVGNEKKGISQLLKKNSDMLITIPHSDDVESLNVATAAGIILFESYRKKKK